MTTTETVTAIEFTNGLTYTLEEAAQALEAEGELISWKLGELSGLPGFKKFRRCAIGVIEQFKPGNRLTITKGQNLIQRMVDVNNAFKGSNKKRCTHVAAWLRKQA